MHAEPRSVSFEPVGWEDTIAGVGRPQQLINDDLSQCDYAVFVFHDRWGTLTGGGYTSGTEEEWELAEKLYSEAKIRNIALFFKSPDARQVADPGDGLKKVLRFKKKIESGKKYLFKSYLERQEFSDVLEVHLAKWLRDHDAAATSLSPATLATATPKKTPGASPGFDFWISESSKLLEGEPADYAGALFCAGKALSVAESDVQWAVARNAQATADFYLNNLTASVIGFSEIVQRLGSSTEEKGPAWVARALFNKGVTLRQLGRSEDALAVYDDVIGRFGTATELPLREQVAGALVNKGFALGQLGRSEDALAVYDDVIGRFGTATEPSLKKKVEIIQKAMHAMKKKKVSKKQPKAANHAKAPRHKKR